MKTIYFLVSSLLILMLNTSEAQNTPYAWPAGIRPPVAEKKPLIRELHGDKVQDDYYWMIDFFKKGPDSSKAVAYLKAENEYLEKMTKGLKPFQEKLFGEMKGRIKEKDESAPVWKNGYCYYTRTETGKQYYKYCRKKGSLSAPEEVLLDVDSMAEGKAYYNVTGFAVSEDNKLLAFGEDAVSRRQYTIRIKNLETGKYLKDRIANTEGDPVWAGDNKTLFYSSKNPVTLLSEKIMKHKLGKDVKSDAVVYEETDKTNYIGVSKSKNNRFIMIYSQATLSSEIRFIDASKPDAPFRVFQNRMKEILYSVTPVADRFIIRTNLDAKNFRLMECPLDKTEVSAWKELVPHRPDILLEGVEEFSNFIVMSERKDGLVDIRIRSLADGSEQYLDFGETAYTAYLTGNAEYESKLLRYAYTSMTTPNSIYDFDMYSGDKRLVKRQEVPGGFIPENYVTTRLYATGRDGVKIPVSIVYKKDFVRNGNAPLLLYGYGSYGISMNATFSSSRLSLLDRGFAFAIAHIRGGEDMGRQWYEDGKMMKKKNTFNDFIDAGKFLIQEKYTSPEHLYAQGGSAGGLLMGAIVNMEPDMFRGVVSQVPFVDVINTMLDESIPLTSNEWDEWGNPKNKEAYFYMKSYSPYENIEPKKYPNLLVTTGLYDSQVQYFEPAKWVAKLRDLKKDDNILLLQTNMDFGHGGASGRFDYLKDVALVYSFMFALEGISN